MSYRRAWLLVEDVKLSFDQAVVRSSPGGPNGTSCPPHQEIIQRTEHSSNFGVLIDSDPDWHNAHCRTNRSTGLAGCLTKRWPSAGVFACRNPLCGNWKTRAGGQASLCVLTLLRDSLPWGQVRAELLNGTLSYAST
jgi:hypothetical protein